MIGEVVATRLGDLLVEAELITEEQIKEALRHQKASGGRLGSCLVKLGHVTEQDLAAVLSRQYGVPAINLPDYDVEEDVIDLLTPEAAHRYQVVPLSRQGYTLSLAMIDPIDVVALDELRFMTGFNIEPMIAPESQVREALGNYYGSAHDLELRETLENLDSKVNDDLEVVDDEEEQIDLRELARESEETPTIQLVNAILLNAVKRGASDVHIEPYERLFRVRFRVDGQLQTGLNPPLRFKDAIISRLKIMARLDITERRRAQDGRIRIRLRLGGVPKELDFRVSVVPTLFGEKVVLRILDRENLMFDMSRLGFEPSSLKSFEASTKKPFGMVLVTGPTGSGKTNTLYSALSQVNRPDKNIMTVEDPVEFNLPGINQVQINGSVGSNFASVLRSFLRQDPDVVMLGEIRDSETAEMAIKAALTGHLVLSTLHTNDAASAMTRLIDMGIAPFLVATSVHTVCAQRLVRRLCTECKEESKPPVETLIDIGFSPEEAETVRPYRAIGCSSCNKMGYKGRVGLYEVMEITEELREAAMLGGTAIDLKRKALENGMITLRRSGLIKVSQGQASIEDVLRETVG